jgi:hypothetical protein
MEGETEAVVWIAVLMQERDTDAGHWDADTKREGMPMEQRCQCQGMLCREQRDTDRARMPIPRSAIPREQGRRCQ